MAIERVAVIGAGPAGRAFALRCAAAGLDVVLEDVMPAKLRRAQDTYAALTGPGAAPLPVRYALTVEDAVRNADLAIDFVPDELESKLEIFSLLDRMAPPHTILLTPTETLSLADLASCTMRPQLCVGLRGVGLRGDVLGADMLGRTVELVRSRYATEAAMAAVAAMLARMGLVAGEAADLAEPMLVRNIPYETSR